mmetsp:Transcript_32865/g.102615  ORF Transcript_32865/g.102615 Transcript_32865/m.102615 type:complete len:466 (-) Transcript_32865:42-1439(-)
MLLAEQNELSSTEVPGAHHGPVQVALLQGRGRGLVTTRRVTAGETLLVSHAFATGDLRTLLPNVARRLKQASPRERDQFFALYDGTNGGSLPPADLFAPAPEPDAYAARTLRVEPQRLKRIVELNSHDLTDLHEQAGGHGDLMAIWLLPSFMNHSCEPSVCTLHVGMEVMVFRASRDLPEGAEVTDSYTNLFLLRSERQKNLREQKGFSCTCSRCSLEAGLEPAAGSELFSQIPADLSRPREVVDALRPLVLEVGAYLGPRPSKLMLASFLPAYVHLARALEQEGLREAADAYNEVTQILAAALPGSAYHVEFALRGAHTRALAAQLPDPALASALNALARAHWLRFGGGAARLRARLAGRLDADLLQSLAAGLALSVREAPGGAGAAELVLHLPPDAGWREVGLLISRAGARAHRSGASGAALEEVQLAFPRPMRELGKARYRRWDHAIVAALAEEASTVHEVA